MAVKSYIDENGIHWWDYETEGISHRLTGHVSSGEDYCGTCDGARCDTCREVWVVWQMGPTELNPEPHVFAWERFDSEAEALAKLERIRES